MAERFNPRLTAWFENGLATGQFKLPNGRHIVLNQFPRLMKETRLAASAGVDPDTLRDFLLAINPKVETVDDGSPGGLKDRLSCECDQLPAVRKVMVQVLPHVRSECWYVYTPPLAVMRESWRSAKSKLGQPN